MTRMRDRAKRPVWGRERWRWPSGILGLMDDAIQRIHCSGPVFSTSSSWITSVRSRDLRAGKLVRTTLSGGSSD